MSVAPVLFSTSVNTSICSFIVVVSSLLSISEHFYIEDNVYRVNTMAGQANISLNLTDSDVDSSLGHSCRLYSFIVYSLIEGILEVGGIIGNSLTFVVFWKGNFKSSTTFLFLSLSLIDSAHLLTTFPLYSVMAFVDYTGWLQGYASLRPYFIVYLFPTILLAKTAAIWMIVLIAVNRYIIVCLPLKAPQWCTVSKVKIQLAVVLIAAVLYNIPKYAQYRVVYHAKHTPNNDTFHMTYVDVTRFGHSRLFYRVYDTVFLLIFLLIVPILTVSMITIRLIKAMKAHRRMQLEMQSGSHQNDSNVTFAFVIVVIVFIACQVPTFFACVLWDVLRFKESYCGGFLFYLGPIVDMLVTCNSSVNFLIYTISNKAFRDVLMEKVFGRHPWIPVVAAHEMDRTDRESLGRTGQRR